MNEKELKQISKLVTFLILVLIYFITGALGDFIGSRFLGFIINDLFPKFFFDMSLGNLILFVTSGLVGDVLFLKITGIKFEIKL